MFRMLTTVFALGALSQPALADDHADYSVGVGFSPFGGSVYAGHNTNAKTSILVNFGGSPEIQAPFKLDIDGTEYTQTGGSSWVGFFLNHRPFPGSEWFRINTGIAIGGIQGELDDGNGNTYHAEYNENPAGYFGLGVGNGVQEGVTVGFDIGGLFTSGAEVVVGDGNGNDLEAIKDSAWFGNVLPNVQLSVGYNF